MPWGAVPLPWSRPWYHPEHLREPFPLRNGGGPCCPWQARDSWVSALFPVAGAAGTPLCLSPDRRAGHAGVCPDPRPDLPCGSVLRRGRQAGAGGGGRRGAQPLLAGDMTQAPSVPSPPSETTPLGGSRAWLSAGGAPWGPSPCEMLAAGGWCTAWTPGKAKAGAVLAALHAGPALQLCLQSCASILVSWNSFIQHIFVEQPPRVRPS